MEQIVSTFIHYKDASGRPRIKKTKYFNHQTRLSDVKSYILKWRKGSSSFELEIQESPERFVDFDDEYIDENKPFGASKLTQTAPATLEIQLRIIDTNDTQQDLTNNVPQNPPINEFPTSMLQRHQGAESVSIAEQPDRNIQQAVSQNRFSSPFANGPITIDEKEAGIQFTKNVNDIQRDQYATDETNAETRRQTGYLVTIQGDKKNLDHKAKHGTVRPKLKIPSSIIPTNERAKWTLLISLVYEICINGKRKFYHHDERQLVTDENAKINQPTSSVNNQALSEIQDKDKTGREPTRIRLTDSMFNGDEINLELKTTVILHAKTHSKEGRLLFCEFVNEYASNMNYETTRLACGLVNDDQLSSKHWIFSNAMIFHNTTHDIGDIEVKDNNGNLIEKIPVRIMKRKMDLNQSNIIKREPKAKRPERNRSQIGTSNHPIVEDHRVQTIYVALPTQIEHSIPTNLRQIQDLCPQNEYLRCQNQSEYQVLSTDTQCQVPHLQNEYVQRYYMASAHSNIEDFSNSQVTHEMFQPEPTEDATFSSYLSYEQEESLSQGSSYLPHIDTFFAQPITNIPSRDSLLSTINEDLEELN